jgi:hypothetical protein
MKTLNTFSRYACNLIVGLATIFSSCALLGSETPSVAADIGAASDMAATRVNVQITEVGCMRTLLVLDKAVLPFENRISQYLSDVDYRVFPSAKSARSRFGSKEAKALGTSENADLVLYATASAREKKKLDDFVLYEGEATVQLWSAVSGELIATDTERVTGTRTSDVVEAARGAVEKAVDAATRSAVDKSLAKAQKMLVHEAVVVGVYTDNALLAIMEYMGKMDGVYHVRSLSFDKQAHEALIEIIGSPRSETYWRAYLENMPRTKVYTNVTTNDTLRSKYPSWFLPQNRSVESE